MTSPYFRPFARDELPRIYPELPMVISAESEPALDRPLTETTLEEVYRAAMVLLRYQLEFIAARIGEDAEAQEIWRDLADRGYFEHLWDRIDVPRDVFETMKNRTLRLLEEITADPGWLSAMFDPSRREEDGFRAYLRIQNLIEPLAAFLVSGATPTEDAADWIAAYAQDQMALEDGERAIREISKRLLYMKHELQKKKEPALEDVITRMDAAWKDMFAMRSGIANIRVLLAGLASAQLQDVLAHDRDIAVADSAMPGRDWRGESGLLQMTATGRVDYIGSTIALLRNMQEIMDDLMGPAKTQYALETPETFPFGELAASLERVWLRPVEVPAKPEIGTLKTAVAYLALEVDRFRHQQDRAEDAGMEASR